MKIRTHRKWLDLAISTAVVVAVLAVFFILGLLIAAFTSTGPWPKRPDAIVADEIEAKLSRVPCVGPMARWERHYVFTSEPNDLALFATFFTSDRWFNYHSVDIDYRQAGFEEFRGGRFLGQIVPPAADDRRYDIVFGHYDIPSRTAYLSACGPNLSSSLTSIVVR